jgi:phage terminase large subunit-like protein
MAKRSKGRALDPVTQYATEVVNGREIASRLVRLACARHLRDLELGGARALWFDVEAAQHVIDFFEKYLCLPDEELEQEDDEDIPEEIAGKPFILQSNQKFIVGSLFGWKRDDGLNRFRVAYWETAKGSGKTPTGAGIGLYIIRVKGKKGTQAYTAGVTRDQARIPFVDALGIVAASPALRDRIQRGAQNLSVPEMRSFLRPISSEGRAIDGKRVQFAHVEELHEHRTPVVVRKLRAGTKNRKNALILETTNAGQDKTSVCWQHHEYSRQVLEGAIQNDAWFAFVCHLDSCEKCYAQGHMQPRPGCKDCDRWDVEGPHWIKANPNLGVTLTWDYLREQVAEAIGMPDQQALVQRLNFGMWVEQKAVWIPAPMWEACKTDLTEEALRGRECILGIDLSSKIDLTCVTALFPSIVDEPALHVDLSDREEDEADEEDQDDEGLGVLSLNIRVDQLSYFWLPKDTLRERVEKDRVPYDVWHKDGDLNVIPGAIIDYDVILRFIIKDLRKKFSIQAIAYDPSNATHMSTRLRKVFGDERVIEIPQGFRHMSEPCKVFEALIRANRWGHDGNKVMTWNMANLAKEENSWKDWRPIKMSAIQRIDGPVASIIGLSQLIRSR